MGELTTERVKRTVIERKLLAALESDSGQVAILATEQDLRDIHTALCASPEKRCKELADDLNELLNQAFPTHKRWRMTEESNGHKWGFWKDDKFECCRICGMVRRSDHKNSPCHGKPQLRL